MIVEPPWPQVYGAAEVGEARHGGIDAPTVAARVAAQVGASAAAIPAAGELMKLARDTTTLATGLLSMHCESCHSRRHHRVL